jgi:hypothetical protein
VSDRIDVLLFLALAGCQRTKLLEQRATPTGAPQAVKPTQTIPLQPVTPQSIVNDMFPIAPQKTQSVECFCSLIPKMSIYMVVQECAGLMKKLAVVCTSLFITCMTALRSRSARLTLPGLTMQAIPMDPGKRRLFLDENERLPAKFQNGFRGVISSS